MEENPSFPRHIIDRTFVYNPATFATDPFFDNVADLLQDIEWQISRTSSVIPFNSPIFKFQGATVTASTIFLQNGFNDPELIPDRDYLKDDFSLEAQYDVILDIASRTVGACLAEKGDKNVLVWRSDPRMRLERLLTPKGLLMHLTTGIWWF
jgi:hypothetical protein